MAGSSTRLEQIQALRAELDETQTTLKALQERVARAAPELLEQDKPPPLTEYNDTVPSQVLALADQGMTEAEWIASFQISTDTWREWLASFPDLEDAAQRARARLLAHLAQVERRAVEKGFHSVPAAILNNLKADARRYERVDTDTGDASALVRVTVSADARGKPSPDVQA